MLISQVLNFRTVESESQLHQNTDPSPTINFAPNFLDKAEGGGEGGGVAGGGVVNSLSNFYLKEDGDV